MVLSIREIGVLLGSLLILHGAYRGPWAVAFIKKSNYTWPASVSLKDGDTYEYIVVGAGAAGSVAAARLALAGRSVLLLEAGPRPPHITKIPGLSMGLLGSPIDWQYKTVGNNVSCFASAGGTCRFSRGKCLGGSTSINYMMYTRGNRRDWQYPLPGWSRGEFENYFLWSEGLRVLHKLPPSSRRYHATDGPVELEFFEDPRNEWQARVHRGYRQLGFPDNRDVNAESQIGVTRVVGYVRGGERMSTARAFLARPDVKRRLRVATDTLCIGVELDSENAARRVTVRSGSSTLRLHASKEIILSAGAIGTPHLLMLSGIGPAAHLRTLGVPPRIDLPVGDNMSDHTLPLLVILVDRGLSIEKDLSNLIDKAAQTSQFVLNRDGPLASIGVTDICAFANTRCYDAQSRELRNLSDACELPSVQVIHSYVDRKIITLARDMFQQATGLNDEVIQQLAAANVDNALLLVSPILLSPESRGRVRLASADPSVPPAIYPDYLSDERDVEEMLRAIGLIRDLVKTPTFRERNAKILKMRLPGCPARGEQYWRCYVQHMTFSVFHAAGTTALGSVLDERLRVRGVRRLRVADLGALPRVPHGTTAAAAMALGERVADFILQESKT